MTDERVTNEINCFQVNGTEDSPVLAQSILPNLDGFENLGETIFNGQHCEVSDVIKSLFSSAPTMPEMFGKSG